MKQAATLKLNLSHETLKHFCDFTKGELIKLTDLAKILGVSTFKIESWGRTKGFPQIQQLGHEGWRFINRQDLVLWLQTFGIETAQYVQRRFTYFSTRELADELGLSVQQVLRYRELGIVKPLNENSTDATYTADDVEKIKTYRLEQQAKEDMRKAENAVRLANPYREYNKQLKNRYDVKENLPDSHPLSPASQKKALEEKQAKLDIEKRKSLEANCI